MTLTIHPWIWEIHGVSPLFFFGSILRPIWLGSELGCRGITLEEWRQSISQRFRHCLGAKALHSPSVYGGVLLTSGYPPGTPQIIHFCWGICHVNDINHPAVGVLPMEPMWWILILPLGSNGCAILRAARRTRLEIWYIYYFRDVGAKKVWLFGPCSLHLRYFDPAISLRERRLVRSLRKACTWMVPLNLSKHQFRRRVCLPAVLNVAQVGLRDKTMKCIQQPFCHQTC